MNVAPLAVFQMLKSMCAGQRLAPSGPAETGPETRGQEPRVMRGPLPLGWSWRAQARLTSLSLQGGARA